jgi:protein disulfide-isomerase
MATTSGNAGQAGNGTQPSTITGLSDDRYSNFVRRDQGVPATGPQPPGSPGIIPGREPPQNGQVPTAIASSSAESNTGWMGANAGVSSSIGPTAGAASSGTQPPAFGPAPQTLGGNPPLGLDGYCPVSLCERQQWVMGDRRWGAIHRGRTYLFVGPDQQRRFLADPDRYAPVISGNDIILAAEQGQAVPGTREHGVFFGGRVYLFSSEASLEKFSQNPAAYANQALEALRTSTYPGGTLR